MRVFIDTNVLVSAAATRGLCADVLREILIHHELVISAPLIKEVENALREKLLVPDKLIAQLIETLRKEAHFSSSTALPDIDIQDKDDLVILSSALGGEADLFITGEKELLELKRVGNMQIVSPRGFWEKLKSKS
ncbi:MAG: putative toxin-antitoxin system toxin component, PIN family [Deltaproteobacteria bacterium]|nr:putative toxin-antitoxin system toxin component, PIN family [Deltaproteobacteria bacterium]